MGASRSCPTRLIEDTPANHDAFAKEGAVGPHLRVANAIVDLITSPNETGGISIGLEGGWGAGKTTTINLIRDALSRNADHTVISFDAWAHEGDPLPCVKPILVRQTGFLGIFVERFLLAFHAFGGTFFGLRVCPG